MPKYRILHITNWYPSQNKPFEAIWIKRHIHSLPAEVQSEVYHLSVQPGNSFKKLGSEAPGFNLQVPWNNWFCIELFTSALLLYLLLFKINLKRYDLVNFHIAYPLCVYIKFFRRLINKPIAINEHWSAYHLNFGLNNEKKLGRIKRIFCHKIPIITVSQALAKDIKLFANCSEIKFFVVPNIVDVKRFYYRPRQDNTITFFMASYWKKPKNPVLVLEAFAQLRELYPDIKLRIGGHGPLWNSITNSVTNLNIESSTVCLGKLTPTDMALEMQDAHAFIHISGYETFSVVCAEAICCGTPVIASNVGGIPEFIDDSNGILIDSKLPNVFKAMKSVAENPSKFDLKLIADNARDRFNPVTVGESYWGALKVGCRITE